jgi:hypothetical protein
MFVMFDMYVKLPPDASPIAVNKFYFKDPIPLVQDAGWAPGLVWMDAENLASAEV